MEGFVDTIVPETDEEAKAIDLEYAKLTNRILKFVIEEKEKDSSTPIVDLIMSFCFKNNIDPELAGDAISQDFYLKKVIENSIKADTTDPDDFDESDLW